MYLRKTKKKGTNDAIMKKSQQRLYKFDNVVASIRTNWALLYATLNLFHHFSESIRNYYKACGLPM